MKMLKIATDHIKTLRVNNFKDGDGQGRMETTMLVPVRVVKNQ